MKLPEKVKVACFDVRIEAWHPVSAASRSCYGEFSSQELLIRVDEAPNGIKVVDTLIHEINHAIYWAYGLERGDEEERVVATLATAWTQVYRDSPDLLEFIKGTLCGATGTD